MGTFVDVYSSLNWANGLILDHPSGMDTRNGKDGHVGWGMAGVGSDFVGLVQSVGSLGSTRLAGATATPIIQAALVVMMGMANSCGFGEPDKGGYFDQGASKFGEAKEKLEAATRPETWDSDAAKAYEVRNREHGWRADRLKAADEAIRDAIKSEAEQNGVTRKMLDRCQTTLGLAIVPAIALNAVPGWGQAASLAFQAAAVAGTLPPAEWRFLDLINNSAHNATVIRRAGATYDQVAAEAEAW
ncbi:EspA/EspE family type VII secretion system effector [Mycolicibacterium sp. HK-90]|uniref:EspA/EspE family type VII secretion system effector n=1 Tax=Mycolicibacterium sp. HK-90 TaxID=3056937 RepID=UPI00265A9DF6|nr:EspA/EspE family type VII secretion system effector [Mycolicibacterium sp. HK-90]WKG04390.1 EspA/EspE family type VII secretion system effector [Mycolicibacterium sp. HK-90]